MTCYELAGDLSFRASTMEATDSHAWITSPPGLENFFREIGRPRVAGEEAPAPFQRPADVVAIERKLGMNDTVA